MRYKVAFFLYLTFCNPPLFAVLSLKQTVESQLYGLILKDKDGLIMQDLKLMPILLLTDFLDQLPHHARAYLQARVDPESDIARYINALWECDPFVLRAETITEDLAAIKKARVPYVKSYKITLTPAQFNQITSFSFLKSLELEYIFNTSSRDFSTGLLCEPKTAMPDLKKLALTHAGLKAGFILNFLKQAPALEDLDLSGNPLTLSVINQIRNLKNMKALKLRHCTMNEKWISAIGGMSQLLTLVLDKADLQNAGLAPLRGLTDLRLLSLRKLKSWDGKLDCVSQMLHLTYLFLEKNQCGLEELQKLKNLQELEELSCGDRIFTDAEIDVLLEIPHLSKLRLTRVVVSQEAADTLTSEMREVHVELTRKP